MSISIDRHHDRAASSRESLRWARLSILSNILLVIGKAAVGLAAGSVAILAEAIHSGVDLLAALMAFVAIRAASRGPDSEHPFGHGKYENLAGAVEALLIVGAGIWIIVEAAAKLGSPDMEAITWLGIVVMMASALINWLVSAKLLSVAKRTGSVALEADGWHLRTDVWSSAGVGLGLGLGWLLSWPLADPLIAILVALLIIWAGMKLTRSAMGGLVDHRMSSEDLDKIRSTLDRFKDRYIEYHDLRTRTAGSEKHVDFHLVVCREATVGKTHVLCDEIERAIEEALPRTHTFIHVEPCEHSDCPGQPGLCDRASPS